MTGQHCVYLGMGANLGDRQGNLAQALQYIRARASVEKVSACYETEPVGYLAQPDFINLACSASTDLEPLELLAFLKQIEKRMGRQSTFRNAPRPIDIDILFYDDQVMESPELVIPHPRLHDRGFVLVPLAEIAPDLVHPVFQATAVELLARLDHTGVIGAARELILELGAEIRKGVPAAPLTLTRVGVTNLRRIIRIARASEENLFYAELDLFADLGYEQPEVSVSRFPDVMEEAADEVAQISYPDIETLTERLARLVVARQNAHRAEAHVRAVIPREKVAPVSRRSTQELFNLVGIAVSSPAQTKHVVGVEAEGVTVSPGAQEMVRDGSRSRLIEEGYPPAEADRILNLVPIASHSQRGRSTLMIGAEQPIRAEELVGIAESSMSCETFGRLSRPDELFVVEKAHRQPRSIGDVVRAMLQAAVERYVHLPDTAFVLARQVDLEGIHRHNAVAERYGALGEIRREMLSSQSLARHTTLQEWLEL